MNVDFENFITTFGRKILREEMAWSARDHWKDLGVGGRITLKWTLGR
jgi:hypothetical protein